MFRRDLRVLAIGSHFDDIWLGCSATLMLLRESYDAEIVCTDLCDIYAEPYFGRFVVDVERTRTEIRDLCKKLFFEEYFVERGNLGALADRDFPKQLDRLSDRIRFLHQRYHDADLVLIPRRDDYHEDHALATKEILKEFRGPMFLEYEIKEFRREPFRPSLFVDVTAKAHRGISLSEGKLKSRSVSIAEKKARIIEDLFTRIFEVPITELPNAFSRENVLGRMALRAEEAGLDSMFAEAFATDLVVK
jgi:hypothetical protein